MSKRYKHAPVNLSDFKDKIEEEGTIPVEAGGRTFKIRPPELLSDDEFKRFVASDDEVEQASILLDDYPGFAEAGGTAMLVGLILSEAIEAQKQAQGVDPGESGASSTS